MKKHLVTSLLYTVITAVLLGIIYPLAITALAHVFFPAKANGQLVYAADGQLIGSKLIGQPFTGPSYFHSRPSSAGAGYDASSSSGSNLGPASKALADRIQQSVSAEQSTTPVPVDLVTSSASGLDPDITPAAALFQVARIATLRGLTEVQLGSLIALSTQQRQFGLLGEPRVNVLALNLALDRLAPAPK
jgi:K+-transporting ATPase ATPase C chain